DQPRPRGERVVEAAAPLALAPGAGFGRLGGTAVALGALPAGRVVGVGEGVARVEAAAAIGGRAVAAVVRGLLDHLDVRLGQFVEEAGGDAGLPQPVHAAVGGEADVGALARPGDADVGQPP